MVFVNFRCYYDSRLQSSLIRFYSIRSRTQVLGAGLPRMPYLSLDRRREQQRSTILRLLLQDLGSEYDVLLLDVI